MPTPAAMAAPGTRPGAAPVRAAAIMPPMAAANATYPTTSSGRRFTGSFAPTMNENSTDARKMDGFSALSNIVTEKSGCPTSQLE